MTGGEAEEAEVPGGPAPCGEGGPQEEETAAQSPQTVSSAQHCLLSNPSCSIPRVSTHLPSLSLSLVLPILGFQLSARHDKTLSSSL